MYMFVRTGIKIYSKGLKTEESLNRPCPEGTLNKKEEYLHDYYSSSVKIDEH